VRRSEWTTPAAISRIYNVPPATVRRWVKTGLLPALQVPMLHYTDDRPRKSTRFITRIKVSDLTRFLQRYHGVPGQTRIRKAPR
jgi:hypothetical protein